VQISRISLFDVDFLTLLIYNSIVSNLSIERKNQMIRLGVNSVLFKHYTFGHAAEAIAKCGYDGVEISAIPGMCEHLQVENWRAQKKEIKSILEATGLTILASEVASRDKKRMKKALEAAEYFNIPVLNVGPGGKTGSEEDLIETEKACRNLQKWQKNMVSQSAVKHMSEHRCTTQKLP
jgi:sugar phosphate isomerase/epimerase